MRDSHYYDRVRRNPTLTLQRIVAGCRPDTLKRIVAQAELARRAQMRKLCVELLGLLREALRVMAPFVLPLQE